MSSNSAAKASSYSSNCDCALDLYFTGYLRDISLLAAFYCSSAYASFISSGSTYLKAGKSITLVASSIFCVVASKFTNFLIVPYLRLE